MCCRGEDYALGPNLNDGVLPENEPRAIVAAATAARLATVAVEAALAGSLVARCDGEAGGAVVAAAMEAVAAAFPLDANVQVVSHMR